MRQSCRKNLLSLLSSLQNRGSFCGESYKRRFVFAGVGINFSRTNAPQNCGGVCASIVDQRFRSIPSNSFPNGFVT